MKGRPNAIDLLKNKEIHFVINTPSGANPRADEVRIRSTAVLTGTPIMTTLRARAPRPWASPRSRGKVTRCGRSRNTTPESPSENLRGWKGRGVPSFGGLR